MKVNTKYTVDVKSEYDEFMPSRAHEFDAGADLFSLGDIVIDSHTSATVATGVAVDVPEGYVGLLFSRSGMGKKGARLSNCVGVIDSGYQGEIGVMITNDNPDAPYVIKRGDRIAQLAIIPCILPIFRMVNEFEKPTVRGSNGFGSTG